MRCPICSGEVADSINKSVDNGTIYFCRNCRTAPDRVKGLGFVVYPNGKIRVSESATTGRTELKKRKVKPLGSSRRRR